MFVVFFWKIKKKTNLNKADLYINSQSSRSSVGILKLHLEGRGGGTACSVFFVFMFFSCFGYIFLVNTCMFFVLLFFTHPPLVGTLSRVIKRQTAGPSTCRLEGGGLLTLSLSFAACM